MTAVARALHREQDEHRVLDDDLALPLSGEEGPAIKSRLQAELT
jgi:hypothetical protein